MRWDDENEGTCPRCGGPLPDVGGIVINEYLDDDEPELGFCSEACACAFYEIAMGFPEGWTDTAKPLDE